MPNHAHNILELFGNIGDVNSFISRSMGDKENLDFNKLVPMPPGLSGFPTNITDVPGNGNMTLAKSKELIEKHGFNNWYQWAVANWGTKWGAYDCGEWTNVNGDMSIFYQTAWAPATEYYLNVSKLFPKLTFKHVYSDHEGRAGFVGYEVIRNGVIEESAAPEWDSYLGESIRESLGTLTDESVD